ncbi:AsmA-like C-terminal region-containing protein [Chrysiogenes arsenatis]|uniref:AsmA-like C-terminal region-containing protein n=1 Tax=Chrysiogenes arsenatis TaxID=309797 RepID=UPI000485DB78|nr:AsmA-like C-terminal region-containing protein [Chrysiogenes arsenatis]
MRAMKIFASAIAVLVLLIGATLALVLSPFGQQKVAAYTLGKLHEEVELQLYFERFTYTLKTFSLILRDERGSRVVLDGTFTFAGTVDAEYQIAIAELQPYEALLKTPLYGSLAVQGTAKRTMQGINVNAAIQAFASHIDLVASLDAQSQPQKLFLKSDSIVIEKLLAFLGQPIYATGVLLADVDLDLSHAERPLGQFTLESKNVILSSALLQEHFQVKLLSNSPVHFTVQGTTEGTQLAVIPAIRSSFFTLQSPGVRIDITSGLAQGELAMVLQNIQYDQWKLPAKTRVDVSLTTQGATQNGVLVSDLFGGTSRIEMSLPSGQPRVLDAVKFDVKQLDIAPVLALAGYPQVATGRLDVSGTLSGFSHGSIRSDIEARSAAFTLNQKAMNERFGLTLEKNQTCTLDANLTLENGTGTAQVEVKNPHWRIAAPTIEINTHVSRIATPFVVEVTHLAAAGLLASPQLQGAVSFAGTLAHEKGKLALEAKTESFGGTLLLALKDERVQVTGRAVEAAKVAHMFRYHDIVRGGVLHTTVDLALVGKDANEIRAALDGSAVIQMQGVQLVSIDVDKVIQSYENSNKIDLFDVGAFVLAGPLGAAVTKGFDFGSLAGNALITGSTVIDTLHADIPIGKGYGTLRDVAFSTPKNRVALKGGLDFRQQRFDAVSIAVLNNKGCATFVQEVNGPFDKPKVEAGRSLIGVAANLVGSIFTGLRDMIPVAQGECVVFYTGSVAHPSGAKR